MAKCFDAARAVDDGQVMQAISRNQVVKGQKRVGSEKSKLIISPNWTPPSFLGFPTMVQREPKLWS
jgi:hypothetical protein